MKDYFLRTIVEGPDFRMLFFKADEFDSEAERSKAMQDYLDEWLQDDEYEVIEAIGQKIFIGKETKVYVRFSFKKI